MLTRTRLLDKIFILGLSKLQKSKNVFGLHNKVENLLHKSKIVRNKKILAKSHLLNKIFILGLSEP